MYGNNRFLKFNNYKQKFNRMFSLPIKSHASPIYYLLLNLGHRMIEANFFDGTKHTQKSEF